MHSWFFCIWNLKITSSWRTSTFNKVFLVKVELCRVLLGSIVLSNSALICCFWLKHLRIIITYYDYSSEYTIMVICLTWINILISLYLLSNIKPITTISLNLAWFCTVIALVLRSSSIFFQSYSLPPSLCASSSSLL